MGRANHEGCRSGLVASFTPSDEEADWMTACVFNHMQFGIHAFQNSAIIKICPASTLRKARLKKHHSRLRIRTTIAYHISDETEDGEP